MPGPGRGTQRARPQKPTTYFYTSPKGLDEGRIRLDAWELDPAVQAEVTHRWHAATPETISELADIGWFRSQFRALYGFDISGIDDEAPVETDIPWPSEV